MAENEAFSGGLRTAKYRQHGYQDSDREPRKKMEQPSTQARRDNTYGPRPLNMPGTRTVSRCAQCGTVLLSIPEPVGQCPKCGFELHSCKQCEHFDPSSRFECNQPVPERISPKDKRNDCQFYSMRVALEKETSSKATAKPNDARAAFDSLFKD